MNNQLDNRSINRFSGPAQAFKASEPQAQARKQITAPCPPESTQGSQVDR